jgi:hypothetical protein
VDVWEYLNFKMVNCTSCEVFAVALDGIEEEKGNIILSVIENLLCDAGKTILNQMPLIKPLSL